MAVNERRLVEEFIELARTNGPSGREAQVAALVRKKLEKLGAQVKDDGTGEAAGSDTGNLIARFAPGGGSAGTASGSRQDAPAVFFCCHLDTVEPTEGLNAVQQGGRVSSDGRTILGADDRGGIAVLFEALRVVAESGLPRGEVEAVFTVGEETGLHGAKVLDQSLLRAKFGYVLDSGGRVGTAVVKAPTELDFKVVVHGRKAHAGVEPEKGINAIHLAARALATLPNGRVDPETTANVGIIRGGSSTNVVPERAELLGEVRSLDEPKAWAAAEAVRRAFEGAARQAGAHAEVEVVRAYGGFDLSPDAEVVRVFRSAAQAAGLVVELVPRGGGSDANIFNQRGLAVLNLGIGAQHEHTHQENIATSDLCKAAELVAEIILTVGRGGAPG